MQLDGLVQLRATSSGRMVGLGVVVLGLAMLATSWLKLCDEA